MITHTEHCLLCSSNNLILTTMHSDAWECWNCQARYWLDDQARLEYMVFNGLGHLEAEEALKEGYPTFAESQMA